jgi:hypothetical protein
MATELEMGVAARALHDVPRALRGAAAQQVQEAAEAAMDR